MKLKKPLLSVLSLVMAFSTVQVTSNVSLKAAFTGQLKEVVSATSNGNNVVTVTFNDGVKGKITFLEEDIFRYNVDPSGKFSEYAEIRGGYPDAKIPQYPDSSDKYSHPKANVVTTNGRIEIKSGKTTIVFDKDTAKMSVMVNDKVVLQEQAALTIGNQTIQTLTKNNDENFYGGGTQNGRFVHTGEIINIANESKWVDGGVSSPNPFYYTSEGYGVLRNTWQSGKYDFGKVNENQVTTTHNENEFDAYFFVNGETNKAVVTQELLQDYYHVTGNPVLLPEYGFYLGHYNEYNRDGRSKDGTNLPGGSGKFSKVQIFGNSPAGSTPESYVYVEGGTKYEIGPNMYAETLNGVGPTVAIDNVPEGLKYDKDVSARAILDLYTKYDMPFGYFLPNDGYGAGYGQNGYKMTGGVNSDGTSSKERIEALDANIANLKSFADYVNEQGAATGLWTQSNLKPDNNPQTYWHLLRDIEKEAKAGVTTLKTDVAWVGPGYSFQLNGVKLAYDTITTVDLKDKANTRPNIVSVDGWAGSQRYNSVWTGDQYGGNWEYIRFHIPTFIGQSLSGNPNVGSDMDGIYGGNPIIATRDYQWKSFAPQMLDMDGWGSYMKAPFTHGDPYTGVSRMYLKLKAQMMPYIYTNAYAAANIDTGNKDQGLPMVRAMFLEFPEDAYAYSKDMQYQYMWGENLLVAPLYENVRADEVGNDVRNGIYLPGGSNQIWIDYFTGQQYRGGQVLNNFDAPIWKLPLFVKNGAILPMYGEHNSALKNDKVERIVEFWPEGTTEFTAIEDDGNYIQNKLENVQGYGNVGTVDYGTHVKTKYTSEVKGKDVTLTANLSTGSYKGYQKEKETTFVVNTTKYDSLEAYNGTTKLTAKQVNDKASFDQVQPKANEYVWFYDKNPQINTYASEKEERLNNMVRDVQVLPKLYVKFAKADTQTNVQKLVIKGFENDGKLSQDSLNDKLSVPTLTSNEDDNTPTSIVLKWNEVNTATSYQLLVDGTLNEDGTVKSGVIHTIVDGKTTYTHSGLNYKSEHSYFIRSVNEQGHSAWSQEYKFTSKEDPWKDTPVPVSVDWEGELYNNQTAENAFNQVFESGDGGFHSSANAIGKKMTVDYGNAYLFDKIEYYHRGNGNGVVTKMLVETSLDGKNWTKFEVDMSTNKNPQVIDLKDEKAGFNYIGARYIRFTALQSVGSFFQATELKTYTVEGENVAGNKNKPFRVGNLSSGGTTAASLENFKAVYMKESSMHSYYGNETWLAEIGKLYGDINFNGYSDIYDYAFTLFEVDGGTKKKGKVSGAILLEPNKTKIKAGETFTIDVTAVDVKNLNAYGSIIHYNPAKVEYVNGGTSYVGTEGMFTDGMTGNIVNGKDAFVNHNASNVGNMPLVQGSKVLSTITMKAKEDITLNEITDRNDPNFILDLSKVTLMGPDYSVVETNTTKEVQIPQTEPVKEIKYPQSAFNITMTNKHLTSDPGEDNIPNVEQFIQSNSYDGLFNGSFANDFEFKWSIAGVAGYEYITLPVTMHFEFKEPSQLKEVRLYNRESGNGVVKKINAVVYFEDGSKQEFKGGQYDSFAAQYTFEVSEANRQKKVTKVEVTPEAAENLQMLTLREIEFVNVVGAAPSEIVSNTSNPTNLYVGYLQQVSATVGPEECQNKYYTVTSSHPDVVKVVTLADENGHPTYYVKGISKGDAEITFTSVVDQNVKTSYTIHVEEGVDKTALNDVIQKAQGFSSDIYTPESYNAFKAALDKAVEVSKKAEATRSEVESATSKLNTAIQNLDVIYSKNELDVVYTNSGDASNKVVTDVKGLYSESNVPGKVFDDNQDTFWETPYYGNNAKLPQEIVLTLDDVYNLEQLSFTSHRAYGAPTDFEVFVSLDGSTWDSVATGTSDAVRGQAVTIHSRFSTVPAKYIKLVVKGSVGRLDSENDVYLRISEMQLFGTLRIDKTDLEKVYNQYEGEKQGSYTDASWKKFQKALENARNVLASANPTEEEIKAAINEIEFTFKELKTKANYVVLNETIARVEAQLSASDINNYTDKSVSELKAMLKEAKALSKDLDSSKQSMIDSMVKALNDVKLVLKDADYSAVDQALEEVKKLNKADYKDFSHVEKAVNAVVRDLDITQQDRVDKMAKAITDAISKLEKKGDTSQPDVPVDPNQPADPNQPVKPTPEVPDNENKPGKEDGAVDTSDSSQMMMWMTLTALAGLGFVTFFFKKRKIEKN